ncbi:MAG: precorrin-4 C(11)-methyltransferase [Deltaproteobacteria bacterium]|nr:precorrin-4 C(11)-methyltransferase [Deltaproteobacteria bacterium]
MSSHPIIFVGAGPGDPELITVKGQKALARADLILYAGSLVSPAMLEYAGADAEKVDTAALNLEEIVSRMASAQRAGKRVVRLHSGDPALFGAIQEQFTELDNAEVPYQVIPGVTAAFAAAAALARELTLPEVTQTVILTRAPGRTPVPEAESLVKLAKHGATMAIYLSVHLVEEVASVLAKAYGPQTPAVVAYRVSWPDQQILRGTLATIADEVRRAGIKRQALILVGPTLAGEGPGTRSKLYDPDFTHGFRGSEE